MSEITKKHIDEGMFSRYEYRNNKGYAHILDGPAFEYDDGDCIWYINGLRHREDGPAIEFYTLNKFEWWLNGEHYRFGEWCSTLNKTPEEIIYFKLKYNV